MVGKYTVKNLAAKNMMFNRPTRGIPRIIRLCVKHARHSSRFVVMEAAGAWTSYALRQAGITNPITVFTNDRADYVRIPTHLTDALRLTRVYGDAHVGMITYHEPSRSSSFTMDPT
jgi:hypothetical protein